MKYTVCPFIKSFWNNLTTVYLSKNEIVNKYEQLLSAHIGLKCDSFQLSIVYLLCNVNLLLNGNN